MAQKIFYITSSTNIGNLFVQGDDGFSTRYDNVTNLIVCGSSSEIIVFSGSAELTRFSTTDTTLVNQKTAVTPLPLINLDNLSEIPSPQPLPPSTVSASFDLYYTYSNLNLEGILTAKVYIQNASIYEESSYTASFIGYIVDATNPLLVGVQSFNPYGQTHKISVIDKAAPSLIPGFSGNFIYSGSSEESVFEDYINISPGGSYIAYIETIGNDAPSY